jgi:hypothetical protein
MKKKILSIAIISMFLFSLIPVQVFGQQEKPNWVYSNLLQKKNLDAGLGCLINPINILYLMGVQPGQITVTTIDGKEVNMAGIDEDTASGLTDETIQDIQITGDLNFDQGVSGEKLREALIALDTQGVHSTLFKMHTDASRKAGSYLACLSEEVIGLSPEELGKLAKNMGLLLDDTDAAKELEKLIGKDWDKICSNAGDLVVVGGNAKVFVEGCQDKLEKNEPLGPAEYKALVQIVEKVGPKLAKKVGGSVGKTVAKWIPFVGQIAGIFLDAWEEQKEAERMEAATDAIQKWQWVEKGIRDYNKCGKDDFESTFKDKIQNWEDGEYTGDNRVGWPLPPNENGIKFREEKKREKAEDRAQQAAQDDMRTRMEQYAMGTDENLRAGEDPSSICFCFEQAKNIKVKFNVGESWDPERVEVEIPLMRGEDYPVII